jgi:hypothetical protein
MTQAHEEYFDPKTGKPLEKNVVAKSEYVNPFSKAFVARNPTVQFEKSPEFLAEEVKFLRRVNADESFSLFNCKKAVTLAIKKYDTPHRVTGDEKESKGGFFSVFQGSRSMTIDHTAHNAHNLAEALRKGGLPETYVLHCRYCSYVTVGGFDSEKDDRIAAMQTFLENRFRNDAFRPLDLFPRPVPMQVPR